MSEFKVTTKNDGKVNLMEEEIYLSIFDKETWEKMKEGYYLPWIEVEEQIPTPTFATKYFNQGPRITMQKESRYTLPWTTEDSMIKE